MSQFVRTRIRCAVIPSAPGVSFVQVNTGQSPQVYKSAGFELELGFFDVDGTTLLDVSNIVSVSALVKTLGNPGSAPLVLKTVNQVNAALTIDQWNNGTAQHALVVFSAADASIAAATYALTIYGATADNALDADVFGTSTLNVIDAGISNVVNPPAGPSPGVDLATLQALLANYVQKIMQPGDTLTIVSQDNHTKRILGIGNDATRIDDLEQQ